LNWVRTMYANYFGFEKLPFNSELHIDQYVYGSNVRQTGNELIKAIYAGRRFITLSGDAGVGKSSLMRQVSRDLEPYGCLFVFVDNTSNLDQFINGFCAALKVESNCRTPSEKIHGLKNEISSDRLKTDRIIVVIDDAHNIAPVLLLNMIRLLQNLQCGAKTIQSVLVGLASIYDLYGQLEQPEIEQMLAQGYCLDGLSQEEVSIYIEQRLRHVGYNKSPLFSDGAINRLTQLTHGNPGRVNVLCGFALLHISLENLRIVDRQTIDIVAHNCNINNDEPLAGSIQSDELLASSESKQQIDTLPMPPVDRINVLPGLTDRYAELGLPGVDNEDNKNSNSVEVDGIKQIRGLKVGFPGARYVGLCASVLIVLSGVLFLISSRFDLLPWSTPESAVVKVDVGSGVTTDIDRKVSGQVFRVLLQSQAAVANDLRSMLMLAESQIAANRLVAPDGDNAMDTYQGILNVARDQLDALNKLAILKQSYRGWAEDAEDQGLWGEAEKYYELALNISPDDESLDMALQRVQNRMMVEPPVSPSSGGSDIDA